MKFYEKFLHGATSWIGFACVLALVWATVSYGAAAWWALPTVNSGSGVSASAWNDIVSQVNGLAGAMTVSSGKVGIGVASPAAKLDVGGRIRTTGNVYLTSCAGGWYDCSPMMCFDTCKAAGDRMASQTEVFSIALRGNDSCSYWWSYYVNPTDGLPHYVGGYPMGNWTSGWCGGGTAGTPRFQGAFSGDTTDLNSATRYACYCSGI